MVGLNSLFFVKLYPGLSICFGHLFLHWNEGLNLGFWNMFGATIVVSIAYLCLLLSLAEMIGTMPFSGEIREFLLTV